MIRRLLQMGSLACGLLLASVGVGGPGLAEAQVVGTKNLAVGKPASQSSTDSGGLASRAVDGNTNGDYSAGSVTHTASEPGAWWQVDLGATYEIGQVVVFNRTDCCADRLSVFTVLASNTNTSQSWREVGVVTTASAQTTIPANFSGRYVRVQLRSTGILSLAEVQVFPLQNLAAGKPASQSSTFGSGIASRAVDGNTNGIYNAASVSHTQLSAKPWWQVDLGREYSISRVKIYNRTDCCAERLADFDILVSNDGTSWVPMRHTASARADSTYYMWPDASGRFVRVQLRGTNYLNLAEVEVYSWNNLAAGKPASQSSTFGSGIASRAVDGNTNGIYNSGSVSHTLVSEKPWWQVDLGRHTLMGHLILHNRTDCCSERLTDYVVLVSDDGTQWQEAGASGSSGHLVSPLPNRSSIELPVPARFVRVQLRGTNALNLAEVQVFPPRPVLP